MCGSGNSFKNLNELAFGAEPFHSIFSLIQASVVRIGDEAAVSLIEQGPEENKLTLLQKKCIDEAIKKAREDNPEFGEWLDEVESVHEALEAKAKKCREIENELEQQ